MAPGGSALQSDGIAPSAGLQRPRLRGLLLSMAVRFSKMGRLTGPYAVHSPRSAPVGAVRRPAMRDPFSSGWACHPLSGLVRQATLASSFTTWQVSLMKSPAAACAAVDPASVSALK